MNIQDSIAGAVAFLACVLFLPIVKMFSVRYKLFDPPGPLKIHSRPISRLGGVAIVLSFALGLLLIGKSNLAAGGTFFAAFLVMSITGLADDIWGLSPASRLVAQIAAASMLWFGGLRIPVPGGSVGSFVGICVTVVIFVNAFNFMDGSDGLLAGIAVIIAATYALQLHGSQLAFSTEVACAVTGSCLGFLLFNFPPASIFTGDSGATALGFTAAFLALNLYRSQQSVPLAFNAAFLPPALPLIDAMLAILRRARTHRSILKGDRSHFYDLCLARNFSSRTVALACYGITGIFCIASWLTLRCTYAWGFAISAITVGGFVVLEWRLGSLEIPKPDNSMPEATAWRAPNFFGNTK